ncbi:MAG: hypothetical protein EA351_06090 [Gemmatimonadales bacterium]|nr:MAG: hypothetical protein EA351_06090 [Gemmatimonadales bacterium]
MDNGKPRVEPTTQRRPARRPSNGTGPSGPEGGVILFPGDRNGTANRFSPLPARISQVGMHETGETMDAMRRLAGRVAHHLNNLLTVVGGNAAYLDTALSGREFESELRDILEACEQATELSSRLLSISGCRWAEPRIFDLRTLVSEMSLGRYFSEDILFCTDLAAKPCSVQVDPAQMKELVIELVLNARDAIQGGGKVRVGIEYLPGMSIEGGPSTGWVQLEVSDSGEGMDQETLSRAFHPFFSTHPFEENRGLGLSVAYAIVRQSGGTLKIFSATGRGTTVRVWLPSIVPDSALGSAGTSAPQLA